MSVFKIPKEVRAHLPVSKETVRPAELRKKMAIYHLTAKTISRGSGSAKARSEYINRDAKYKKDNEEVLYKTSGNMPDWAKEEKYKYWEAADTYERENGRLFKQLEFALPKELKPEEQKELVKNFVNQLTTTKDGLLPYSFAIHKGHERENPHCHVMISERVKDEHERSPETWFKRAAKEAEKGGARKSEALKPKEWLVDVRKEWSLQANKALERAGHEARIDHRTLEKQGIDREPTKHRGVALNAMLMSGKITKDEIEKDIAEPINKKEKEAELSEAMQTKRIIMQGMADFRKDFDEEKSQRLADERARQQKLELEKKQQLEREKLQKQELQNKLEQQNKSKGMGFSR